MLMKLSLRVDTPRDVARKQQGQTVGIKAWLVAIIGNELFSSALMLEVRDLQ